MIVTKSTRTWTGIVIAVVLIITAITLAVVLTKHIDEPTDDEIDRVNLTIINDTFPEAFLFGAATASYQIEGYSKADGKGTNVWDDLTSNTPHLIADGMSGDDGPDSYIHYKDDVRIVKETGFHFYRFSISWARVLSTGDISSVNEAGIDYYNNLINELLVNDIVPLITIYHWDMPTYIQDMGGFLNPLFADYFEQYANLLFERFGDRVPYWITFNEPSVFCVYGYTDAIFPPLLSLPGGEYYCAHHMLLAHARVYHLYRERYYDKYRGKVGITLNSAYHFPNNPNDANDRIAAERAQQFDLGWFAHPIFTERGGYPQLMVDMIGNNSREERRAWSRLPEMDEETKRYIKGTSDFFGLNYYTGGLTLLDPNPDPKPTIWSDPQLLSYPNSSWPVAKSSWLFSVPEGLSSLLRWIKDEYNNPEVFITENGWSDDGEDDDDNRIEYLRSHLEAVMDAMKDGCRVRAHTTWSIVDNFEWRMGFSEKFGIYSFDATSPTKERKPKKSVSFLQNVIQTRKLPPKQPTDLFP